MTTFRTRSALLVAAVCVAAAGCIGGSDGDADGESVITVFGPYRGSEADSFASSIEGFTERTGIEIRYTGSADFVTDLARRSLELNDPPDVAMVPQPGVLGALVDEERIAPLSGAALDQLDANYSPQARALGEVDGTTFAVPFRINIKSLVWYRPEVFDERGWERPHSLDELEATAARIQAEGSMAPWCLALESGTSTGWPATDWIEDLVLRRAGAEAYEAWAAGELPFASPAVTDAFEQMQALVLADGRVHVGAADSVEIPTTQVVDPLFGDDPGCAMAKQADFAIGWMPPGTSVGPDGDVDFFVLPAADPDAEPPLVVGGDLAVQFRSSPDVDAFIAYLAESQVGAPWASAGGFLSPKQTFDRTEYRDDTERRLAELLTSAEKLAFDASDRMPAEIGSRLLWDEITLWVAGARSYDDVAERLDEAFRAVDAAG